MIIAQYTASASGVVPRFDPNCVYTANEIDNGNGTYTVTLTADNDFTYVDFNDSNNLLSVEYLKVTNKVTHLQETFNGCELLTSVNASDWDTSNVEDMDSTFCFCYSLNTITGIENWNTNSLTALSCTFCDCRALTSLNLSNWNTSNVTAAEQVFCDCASLTELDIRNWDLSNAGSNIDSMITYYEFEPKLKVIKCNNPETISLIDSYLPDRSTCEEAGIIITDNTSEINTEGLVNLNWKVAGLIAKYKYYKPTLTIDMDSIMYQIPEPTTFNDSGFIDTGIQLLKDDSDWTLFLDCIPNIDNKTQAIIHCVDESNASPGVSLSLEPNGNINIWDGTNGTVLGDGRYLNKKIKIAIVKKDNNIIVYHNNISSIQYQRVYPITIPYTFKSANTTLSIGGGHIGTSAINTFSGVINNFVIYNKALESEDCESIINDDPRPIFNNDNNFNYTIEDKYLDTDDEEIVTRSIYAATDFTSCRFEGESGLATVEYLKVTNKVTTMNQMFYNCYSMTSVNANGWDTSNVTSMVETFSYCCDLEEIIGIENWDTSSLTNLAYTFNCCCERLTSLNLSGWDTSNVTNMYGTFGYCCSLEEIIGIENWDTSSVTDLSSIFECCESLTSLNLSDWDTSKVTSMWETFSWCCSLEEIIGIENWDTSSVEDLTYTFTCCESLTSLNLSGWDTSNVIYTDETFSDCTYLEELDISNWDLSNADPDWLANMFYISELDPENTEYYDEAFKPYLKVIKCNNANTISLIAPYLQNRSTCEEAGMIITDNVSEVNAEELVNLNWKVTGFIAQYKFDKSIHAISTDSLMYQTPAPITSNNSGYMDTGIQLLKNDSDWTIFLDCIPNFIGGDKTAQAVIHCVDESGTWPGISFSFEPNGSINLWDGTKGTVIGQNYLNKNIKIVIVKKGTNIIIYHNDDPIYQMDSPIIIPYTFKSVNSTLSIGGGHLGTTSMHLFTGAINNFILYNEALEEQECNSIINNGSLPEIDSPMYQTPAPIIFNNSGYIDTGIQLLKNNSDWSMLLDCIPNNNTTSQAVIHCLDESGIYPGISFSFGLNGSIGFYDGINSTVIGSGDYLNKNIKIFIVKKDNNIIIYHNNDPIYQISSPTIIPYTFRSVNSTLSIGGGHLGATSYHPFTGTINNFTLYNEALEEQECKSIMNNGLLPEFNNDFNYTIEDEYLDTENENIVTRSIYSDTDFTSCSFDGATDLLSVKYLKVTNKVTSTAEMFYNCESLTSVNVSGWDTSNVTEMWEMFYWCCDLEKIIGIENWDTSSLTDLTSTFNCCCERLTSLNLSGWDTSKVTLADGTFSDCTKLEELDITNWDLSNANTNYLSKMFYISELDPENTDWYDPNFKPYLKTIRCNNANTISLIDSYLPDRSTCEEAGTIITNATGINTSTLTSINWEIPTSGTSMVVAKYTFDKSVEENIVPTFNNNFNYTIEDEYLDAENENIVTRSICSDTDFTSCSFMKYIDGKIQGRPGLLTIEYLKITNKVTSLKEMFRSCSNLTKINTTGWDTSNVTNMESVFFGCKKIELLDLNNLDTSKVTIMHGMFSYANTDAVQGLEDLDVSKVDNFSFMFYGCYSAELDLNKWDMSSATNLYVMFTTCYNLTSLKISNWNTSNVTSMSGTFWCSDKIKKLDVSGWTSDKCTSMPQLFGRMWALEELDLGNLKIIDNVTGSSEFFLDNVNLKIIHTSNLETIIKLPELLPDRTGKYSGEIRTDIPKGELDQNILAACSAKNWKIVNGTLVAKYTFDNIVNENLIPVFDTSFTGYEIEDEYLDADNENIVTRYIYSITHKDFTSCKFTNKTGLLSVEYLRITNKVTNLNSLFSGCSSLTKVNTDDWDTSNVTTFGRLAYNCSLLKEIDVSDFNTSKMSTMYEAFNKCSALTQLNVSNWDTSVLNDLYSAFADCSGLIELDLSNWDVKNVTDMRRVFAGCRSLTTIGDVSNWDTSKVTTMYQMFIGCNNLTSINVSNWDTSQVQNLEHTFSECSKLTELNISDWNTESVTTIYGIFYGCTALKSLNINNWNVDNVKSMSEAFRHSGIKAINLDNWNVSNVTSMNLLFEACEISEINISNWKFNSNVAVTQIFDSIHIKKIIINNSDVFTVNTTINRLPSTYRTEKDPGVLDIRGIDNRLQVDIELAKSKHWNVELEPLVAIYTFDKSIEENVVPVFNDEFDPIIEDAYLDEGNENIVTRYIYSATEEDFSKCSFYNKTGLLSIEHLKVTDKVTSMNQMFFNCSNLTSINVDNWDTSQVQNLEYAFSGCSKLTELDISDWDVDEVSNTNCMFEDCSLLTTIGDVSSWNTGKVTTMQGMFRGCSSLTELNLKNWDTSAVTNTSEMFNECSSLRKIICDNSVTINKITNELPIRSENDPGKINTICKESDINIEELSNKYWLYEIREYVAKYTCNASGILPTFNNGYEYKVSEIDNGDGTYTVIIFAEEDFTSCKFSNQTSLLTVEYLKVTNKVTTMDNMFYNCRNVYKINARNWDTSNVTNLNSVLGNCSKLVEIDLSDWDTGKVTTMHSAFREIKTLQGYENLDVSKVTEFSFLFYGSPITELDLSKWDMSSAKSLYVMFTICSQLKSLKVNTWNTSNVTSMNGTFLYVDKVKKLDVSSWTSDKCTNMSELFKGMWALEELDLGYLKLLDHSQLLTNNPNLKKVFTSNAETIMLLSNILPSRAGKAKGEIVTNVSKSILDEDMLANFSAKNWVLIPGELVAKYTFDKSVDENLIPVFNDNFNYAIEDEYLNAENESIVTRSIYSITREDFTSCSFNNKTGLLSIDYLKITDKVTDMRSMFSNCNNLASIDTNNWDTSKVIDMSSMFYNCSSLTELNVNNLNTDLVQNLAYTFSGCLLTKLNISNWNVGNVINMSYMFKNCSLLTTIGDVNDWETNKVTNMQGMFCGCSSLTELSLRNWGTGAVTNTSEMFKECTNLRKVICDNSETINKIVDGLPIRSENDPGEISTTCRESDINIEGLSNKYWLYKLRGLVAKYTCNVSGIIPTFNNGYIYKIDEVDNGDGTYTVTILSDTDFTSCSFKGKTELLSIEYLKITNKVTSLAELFQNCSSLTKVNTVDWNTSSVTAMRAICWNCSKLTEIDVSNWNTSNVTTLYLAFCNCSSLLELNTSNWNLNKVTSLAHAFQGCLKLTKIDVSNWNTNSLTNAFSTFYECDNLTTIKGINNLNMSKVTEIGRMFANCKSVTELDLGNWVLKEDVVSSENLAFNNMQSLLKITVNKNILLKIGELLPSRVGKEQGLVVCKQMVTGIDTSSIEAKNWMVEFGIVIAKYTSKSIGLRPTFNNGYNYVVAKEDLVDDVYEIELRSEEYFASCSFNGKTDLLTVDYLNVTSKVNNMNSMFTNCSNLIEMNVSNWDVSNVHYMYNVFSNCSSLTAINGIGNWETDNLSCVHFMFNSCKSLTELNIGNWNMSKVTDIYNAFAGCNNLTSLDLSNWKISNINNMSYMFTNCWSLTTIGDISNWDTSKVTSMLCLFYDCASLTSLDVSKWDTGKVTTMDSMFYNCRALTSLDVSNWNTSSVTRMHGTFNNCKLLTSLDVSKWDTGKVTFMNKLFANCESLTSLDLSNWDTGNVTDMYQMFTNCKLLTSLDLSKWNMGNVTDVREMFSSCPSLTSIGVVSNWDISNVTKMCNMFRYCNNLTSLDVSKWDTGNVTDMGYMFEDCFSLQLLDVSKWDTGNVTIMNYMFHNCKSLTKLDLRNWDIRKITSLQYFVQNCSALTKLDVSKWDTSNVSNMHAAFNGLTSLKTLDASSFDMSNATNITYMFNATGFEELNISGWKFNEKVSAASFLTDTNVNLTSIILKNSNSFTVNKTIEMVINRSGKAPGVMIISGIDDISKVNINSARAKNWNVCLVAPGPRELESMIFNNKTSSGNKINSKYRNGHIVKIIYNK